MTLTLTKTQVPYTGPYSISGNGLHKGPTAKALKRGMARLELFPWTPDSWDENFNGALEAALDKWNPGKDGYGPDRYDLLRRAKVKSGAHAGEFALDSIAIALIKDEYAKVHGVIPVLGPVYHGGVSLLDYSPTHNTDGVPFYPAFDTAFSAGTGIIAPERMTVTKQSHSVPGHAFYAKGASRIQYWVGHLDRTPFVGQIFNKGDFIGRVVATSIGGGSHCHWGVNVELLWGVGRELFHPFVDYTLGAPSIRQQLLAHLS